MGRKHRTHRKRQAPVGGSSMETPTATSLKSSWQPQLRLMASLQAEGRTAEAARLATLLLSSSEGLPPEVKTAARNVLVHTRGTPNDPHQVIHEATEADAAGHPLELEEVTPAPLDEKLQALDQQAQRMYEQLRQTHPHVAEEFRERFQLGGSVTTTRRREISHQLLALPAQDDLLHPNHRVQQMIRDDQGMERLLLAHQLKVAAEPHKVLGLSLPLYEALDQTIPPGEQKETVWVNMISTMDRGSLATRSWLIHIIMAVICGVFLKSIMTDPQNLFRLSREMITRLGTSVLGSRGNVLYFVAFYAAMSFMPAFILHGVQGMLLSVAKAIISPFVTAEFVLGHCTRILADGNLLSHMMLYTTNVIKGAAPAGLITEGSDWGQSLVNPQHQGMIQKAGELSCALTFFSAGKLALWFVNSLTTTAYGYLKSIADSESWLSPLFTFIVAAIDWSSQTRIWKLMKWLYAWWADQSPVIEPLGERTVTSLLENPQYVLDQVKQSGEYWHTHPLQDISDAFWGRHPTDVPSVVRFLVRTYPSMRWWQNDPQYVEAMKTMAENLLVFPVTDVEVQRQKGGLYVEMHASVMTPKQQMWRFLQITANERTETRAIQCTEEAIKMYTVSLRLLGLLEDDEQGAAAAMKVLEGYAVPGISPADALRITAGFEALVKTLSFPGRLVLPQDLTPQLMGGGNPQNRWTWA